MLAREGEPRQRGVGSAVAQAPRDLTGLRARPYARIVRARLSLIAFSVIGSTAGCGNSTTQAGDGGAVAELGAAGDLAGAGSDLAMGDGAAGGDLAMVPCPDNPFSSFAEVSIRFTGMR